jgi:3' terminal RNA ribose 2'-O-methyltransferase Hen1
VLLPVLDNDKHYYVDQNEAEKLLHRGGDWLPRHPERGFITRRYLRYRALYVNPALARLLDTDELTDEADALPTGPTSVEEVAGLAPDVAAHAGASADVLPPAAVLVEATKAEAGEPTEKISLHDQRLQQVAQEIYQLAPKRVLDLGCGEGKLLRLLLRQPKIDYILGMDVSHQALARAAQRLHLAEMPPRQRARLDLLQGSLLYKDERLAGFDAAALVEVIEHLDASRLATLEAVVFGHARPAHVFVTTPNADYNQLYDSLSAGTFRHADHRFEWGRAEFAAWAAGVAERHGYQVRLEAMGEETEGVGAPSQLAVFTLVV